jgi:MFS transporter, DHA2 family, multidrug resistance protein
MRAPSRAVATHATPSIAATPSTSSAYLWWAMTSIVLGGYISVLTNHVMNMVLPKMMSDLGTDVVTIRWVVTAYMIANAVVMPLSGWLARTLGARDLFIWCLVVFIGSTVACGMATSVPMLVVFRIIQGAGGGLIMPVTMLLMLDLYPAHKRGLGTSIWSMGASCGSLTGIPLGGFVAEHLSWRAAFYLILPAGIVALLIACCIMRKSPRERGVPFDWFGALTLGTAMVALLLALSNGQREGWDSSPIVALLLICALALGAFLLIEPHATTPIVDLRAFRSPQYAIGIGLCFVAGAMFNGGPFLLSLFLQSMYDFSVQDAAMIMFPSSALLVLFTPISGWTSDRIDARYLMILGYLCYAVFGLYMTFADLRLSAFALLIIYFGRGLGLGLSYAVIYPIAISGLEAARGKAATTLLNLCLTLGGALNVSMLAALLEQRQQVRYALLAETQALSAVGTQHALRSLEAVAAQLGGALAPAAHAKVLLSRMINQEALLLAFNDAFSTFVVISLGGLVLALFFRRARPQQR